MQQHNENPHKRGEALFFGTTDVPRLHRSWITIVQHRLRALHNVKPQDSSANCKLPVTSEALMDLPEALANFRLFISPCSAGGRRGATGCLCV